MRLKQHAVGRYLITGAKHHHITHYNLLARHLLNLAVTYNGDHDIIVHGIQHLKGTCGLHFKEETYGACKHYCKEDTERLKESGKSLLLGPPAVYR